MIGILLYVGMALGIIGWVWILVTAFKESVVWGLVSLCVPFGIYVYGFMRFGELKVPMTLFLIGSVCQVMDMVR